MQYSDHRKSIRNDEESLQHIRRIDSQHINEDGNRQHKVRRIATVENKNKTKTGCPFYGCSIYPPELTIHAHLKAFLDKIIHNNNSQLSSAVLKKDTAALALSLLSKEDFDDVNNFDFEFATDSFASLTQKGKSHTINQDRAVYISPFLPELSLSSSFLAAIFDGHGKLGHDVAQEVVERFPLLLAKKIKAALLSSSSNDKIESINDANYKHENTSKTGNNEKIGRAHV